MAIPQARTLSNEFYKLNIGAWELYYAYGQDVFGGGAPEACTEVNFLTIDATVEEPESVCGRNLIVRVCAEKDSWRNAADATQGVCELMLDDRGGDLAVSLPMNSMWQVTQLIKAGTITKISLRGGVLKKGRTQIHTVAFTSAGEGNNETLIGG